MKNIEDVIQDSILNKILEDPLSNHVQIKFSKAVSKNTLCAIVKNKLSYSVMCFDVYETHNIIDISWVE